MCLVTKAAITFGVVPVKEAGSVTAIKLEKMWCSGGVAEMLLLLAIENQELYAICQVF